ncbi:MAG: baseplate J/gp47 family protein [Oscillospiraceae bacterium]|nr:baseplate J/gp47 family protein [Oscillospiraceae bacterium]
MEQAVITIQTEAYLYTPLIAEQISLEFHRAGVPGRLTFQVVKDSVISFHEGDRVVLRMGADVLLERLLDGARAQFPELDTREGSLIYSALAPAAVELSKLYTALHVALEMSFADTAGREYLVRRASERSMAPFAATAAVVEAVVEPPGLVISVGTRFRSGAVVFAVSGRNADGRPLLTAEIPGVEGNLTGGRLVPVEVVDGLREASIRALIVPGQDEESTEAFRKRYMESHRAQSFGGNIAAYREKVLGVAGVGGVRVFPAQSGPGTVGIGVLGADFRPPSAALITDVQEMLDPRQGSGEGRGWAPIGHRVTVFGATAFSVAVTARLVLESGANRALVEGAAREAVEAYLLEVSAAWDRGETLVVRVSQVDTRLLDVTGVLDVADTTLNGQRGNLSLQVMQVPTLGTLVLV